MPQKTFINWKYFCLPYHERLTLADYFLFSILCFSFVLIFVLALKQKCRQRQRLPICKGTIPLCESASTSKRVMVDQPRIQKVRC